MLPLDELIKKFRSDSVHFIAIKDIAEVSIGEFVHKNKQNPNGEYPVYNGGVTNTGFYDNYNREGNQIIISARGNAGYVNRVFTKFWSGNSCYTITVNSALADWNFVYYAIKKNEKTLQNAQQKGGIPAVSKKQVEQLSIPLPPLPVQQEIVRILDSFTSLTAELTAELTARRKQYEYYRDELLTFGEEVPRLPIGELFMVRNGYTPSKSNTDFWDGGTIPWVRMEDIRVSGRILYDTIQKVTPLALKKGGVFPAGSVIVSTTATIGEYAILMVDALTNQQITCLTINEGYKGKLLPKFVFYYAAILGEWCKKNVNQGGGLLIIGVEKIRTFMFPVPSIEAQKKIINILDRFDNLCNDISSGLPAEIAARQKQYEYYRDKLLSFKELGA